MTKERAIERLKDLRIAIPIPKAAVTARETNEAIGMAIEALEKAAINTPSAINWAPCNERLPKTDDTWTDFLVTVDCDSWESPCTMVMTWENVVRYGKPVSRWTRCGRLVDESWRVVAWAPLPGPYANNMGAE